MILQKGQILIICFMLLIATLFSACSRRSSTLSLDLTPSPNVRDNSTASTTASIASIIPAPTLTRTPTATQQVLTSTPPSSTPTATPQETIQPTTAFTPDKQTSLEPHTTTGIHLSLKECEETMHFVLYCTDFDKSVMPLIAAQLENDYERLTSRLQHYPSEKITVEIYPNLQSYHAAIGHQQGYEWLVGGAWSGMMGLVTPLNPGPRHTFDTIMQTATHELIHLIVDEMSDTEIPVWLNEGIATYESGQRQTNFAAWIEDGVPSIADLNFSSGIETGAIYSFSYTIVEFIVREFGYDLLIELVETKGDFEESLGISESDFENAWHQFLLVEYGLSQND